MLKITTAVESRDRVVTAGRINAGKETMDGLTNEQARAVERGEAAYLPSRHGPRVTAEISDWTDSPLAKRIAESQPGEVLTLPELDDFGPCVVLCRNIQGNSFTAKVEAV